MSIVTRGSLFLASARSSFAVGRVAAAAANRRSPSLLISTSTSTSSSPFIAATASSRLRLYSTEAAAAEAAPNATSEQKESDSDEASKKIVAAAAQGVQGEEEQLKAESLAEYLERIEREDQAKLEAAHKAFASGNAIDDHINSVLGLQKYKCIVFMYGDEHAPQDGETYMVIKQLQRDHALFKTFDLSKYPLLKEGLINHKGSYVRGDEDIPQVYVLGRPLGSTREVMDAVATGQLEARLRLTRSQRHFYATH
jgi:glutaredoxin-related protein